MADTRPDETDVEEEAAAEDVAADDDGSESEATEDESAETDGEGADEAEEGAVLDAGAPAAGGDGEEEEEPEEPKLPLRERIDGFLDDCFKNEQSAAYLIVSNLVIMVILFSIASILVESVPSIYQDYEPFFKVSEVVVVVIFLLEYAGTLYVTKPWTSYALGKWGIIDMLAILPSVISWISLPQLKGAQILRILRILRFLRLMRLLKLTKGAATDYKKLTGVTLLAAGVPFLAGGILISSLPEKVKVVMGCAGFVMIGIGDLIYLGSLHIKPLTPEEQEKRNRQVFLSRVARARGLVEDEGEAETE
jgi:hypothetical protein